ncbi:unnamed protein product [Parnassius apollo]|uniref:(apollo) hypothetical protein n=1 Tax=Parnassius apollo TaxID=110799 RepID=A0A8S3X0U4_PARAO|nr:unnamed protein product [Parnassius apollo]
MSALQNAIWSKIPDESLNPKYEKCRNITEEIYKRINITFQIKKLEKTGSQSDLSDLSDQIDSNDLSNETDLFACDKSSLSSSTDPERTLNTCEKYININNNEETKVNNKPVPIYKRPRKRFRKRVKKHQTNRNRNDSDGSSDEALPLSRVDVDTVDSQSESPDSVMGVPNIVIVTKEIKPKLKSPTQQKNTPIQLSKHECTELSIQAKKSNTMQHIPKDVPVTVGTSENCEKTAMDKNVEKLGIQEGKNCPLCNLSFRGERGLRRHMTMSHITVPEEPKKAI